MSIIKELKRRNVIRVAIVYAVAAWLLIEIAATTFPILQLPDWSVTLVTVLVLIGFPLALILAWAFELTPEGIKLEKDVDRSESITHVTGRKLDFIIITALVLALAYFAYDEFAIEPAQEEALATTGSQADTASDADTSENSIAVLPFVNMSDDPGNEYFSDGLSEEILNLLAKISDLKVIGRTSSFAFKGKNTDLRDIGQALGVKTVLEGSVRKSGERVRITAQLIDVTDGAHIWSETYDRTMTDIFAVQDDVAAAIIDALQIHVGANPTRGRPTENPEAYALFLKAKAAVNVFDWQDAEELVLQAIELDPNFAEAYEVLAFAYWNLGGDVDDQRRVHETAAKAIALNPDLVMARAAYEASMDGPYTHLRALQAYERAARKQPDSPWVLEGLVYLLTYYGYLEEALRIGERYVELDPLSLSAQSHRAATLYAVGRTSEAVAVLEFANQSDLDPDFWGWTIEGVNLVENRDETTIAHFESWLQQQDYPDPTWFRELVTGARDPVSGQAYLDRHIPEIVASMAEGDKRRWRRGLTSLYLYFGYLDRQFELILATEPDDMTWHYAGTHVWRGTIFRRLGFTAHPKYLEVAELLGVIHIWEQRGPPDFCEKVGGKWVCE
jgi:TolB-like protein/Flp pilus assembly protein TadD